MKKFKLLVLAISLIFIISGKVNASESITSINDLTKEYESGTELKLEADISLAANTAISDVILDLNGHVINTAGYVLIPEGNVTVKDSSSNNTGKILNNTNSVRQLVQPSGNFVFESGTIDAKNGYAIYVNGGKTIIKGGVIDSASYAILNAGNLILNGGNVNSQNGFTVYSYSNSTFEMNGGTINYSGDGQAIFLKENCSAVMNGGEVLAPNGRGVAAFKNTYFEMNDGKIIAKIQALTGNGSTSGTNEGTNAKFKITGGTLESTNGVAIYLPQPQGETTITGGTIKGVTGIEIRAGKLNVSDAEIISSYIPTESEKNGNGSTTKGAAIAVVQHTTKLPIDVTVSGGYFEAYTPFIQQNVEGNEQEAVDKVNIKIEDGVFNTIEGDENNHPTASVFSENKENFITGGAFSIVPESKYIGEKLNAYNFGDYFYVIDNVIFEDEESPIAMISSEPLPKSYKLEIIEVEGENFKNTASEVEEKFKSDKKIKDTTLLGLYDINMKNGENIVSIDDNKLLIYVEMDKDLLKYDHYKVVYIDENGEIKEEIDAKLATEIFGVEIDQDNILVFETTHLSTYGIVGYNDVKVDNNIPNSPTGDNIVTYIAILFVGLIGAILSISFLRKKYAK